MLMTDLMHSLRITVLAWPFNARRSAIGAIALYGMVAASVLTILVSMTLTVILKRRKRRTWPIPLIGLGVTLAAFLVAMLLIDEDTG
jgi:prepilin signal peptidase PulO-like enzyme (type II secretory pathway)